jgi:transposase
VRFNKKPIRQIVRELRLSRQTVRKAIRGSSTEFRYERQVQLQPRLGAHVARLEAMLEANSKRPARERLTARRLFELLRAEGYEGAYDTVQRHVREWRRQQSRLGPAVGAILPLPPKIREVDPGFRTIG